MMNNQYHSNIYSEASCHRCGSPYSTITCQYLMPCDAIQHDTQTIASTAYHSVKVQRPNQHDPCLSGTTSSWGHGRRNHYLSSIGAANMVVSLDVFRGSLGRARRDTDQRTVTTVGMRSRSRSQKRKRCQCSAQLSSLICSPTPLHLESRLSFWLFILCVTAFTSYREFLHAYQCPNCGVWSR